MSRERAVVAVTLGNELRGDDAAGILFGRMLEKQGLFQVIEGGSAPENVTGRIIDADPAIVLIVDALDFGGKPGDYRLFLGEELGNHDISTHASLSLFIDYLRCMTRAKILILGFQPGRLGIGEEMSGEVAAGVDRAVDEFTREEDIRGMIALPVR